MKYKGNLYIQPVENGFIAYVDFSFMRHDAVDGKRFVAHDLVALGEIVTSYYANQEPKPGLRQEIQEDFRVKCDEAPKVYAGGKREGMSTI